MVMVCVNGGSVVAEGEWGSGSVPSYSWHFDTRDGELAVGTAARM